MSNGITAWSYSRVEMYGYEGHPGCPAQFKYKHLDKLYEEPSPAMARGTAIHKKAADFIMGKITDTFPTELTKFDKLFWELHDIPENMKVVEQQWGFNNSWRATGWFGKDTWLRVVCDAAVVYEDATADCIDHKTGKQYATNHEQMRLNSLGVICRYPQVGHVTNRLWYLDSGVEVVSEFDADEKAEEIEKWEARVAPMFEDTVFAPRPSDKCNRCAFSKSKRGPCRYG